MIEFDRHTALWQAAKLAEEVRGDVYGIVSYQASTSVIQAMNINRARMFEGINRVDVAVYNQAQEEVDREAPQ